MRREMTTCGAVALLAGSAGATVLTFDLEQGSFGAEQAIPQSYGDRVVAAVQDGFVYGTDFGFTPNVVVDWNTGSGSVGSNAVYWGSGFGDLVGVIEAEPEPSGTQFSLVADAGFEVQLHGFDMASFDRTRNINSVRVLDGNDAVLFEALAVDIDAATHTSFDFDTPLQASVIKIEWDSSNQGGSSDNIGMDTIAFGQVVPAPGVFGLLAMAGLASRRRRG